MSDYIGRQFGNYRLMRSLGRGGFAEVYLGEHIHIKKQAAIKVLSNPLRATDRDRFIREAQTITSLQHPHIVQVFDFGIQEEIPFLVMNYAPNGTLRQRYSRESRVPLKDVLSYVQQIASALQHAHDHHIIHRDVKPENMLLGSEGEMLLSDFGIALVTATSTSQQIKTTAGTAAYMAPEQVMGKPCIASDQYALAVAVYEWLSGKHPFHGTLFEMFAQHLHAPVPSLHEANPEILPAVGQCIAKALSKDPKERFASIQDFATTLLESYQLASSVPASLPTQQHSLANSSGTNIDEDDLTVLKNPSEMQTPHETGLDGLTVLKVQLDALVLTNTGQDNPTSFKTEQTTLLSRPPIHDQPALLKKDVNPIDHVEPALIFTAPSILTDQAKCRGKSKHRLIIVACTVLVVLLVAIPLLSPWVGANFAKFTPISPIATNAAISHSTNTPTQQPTPQSTPEVQTTQLTNHLPTSTSIPVTRLLSSIQRQSTIANATGQGTTPATSATGTITIITRYSRIRPTHLAAGTILTNTVGCTAQGLQIQLDSSIDMTSSGYGSSTIHVVQAGAAGNIRDCEEGGLAFYYCDAQTGEQNYGWAAHDLDGGFANGTDAQQYTYVQQNDIDNAAAPLKTSTTQAAKAEIQQQLRSDEHLEGDPLCTSDVTSDHAANDRAPTVTVMVSTSCRATALT